MVVISARFLNVFRCPQRRGHWPSLSRDEPSRRDSEPRRADSDLGGVKRQEEEAGSRPSWTQGGHEARIIGVFYGACGINLSSHPTAVTISCRESLIFLTCGCQVDVDPWME
jgi:hypothetical protein